MIYKMTPQLNLFGYENQEDDVSKRIDAYNKDHCWQYDIRLKNLESDLVMSGISHEEAKQISISDFSFDYIHSENKSQCQRVKRFIERHEWLGKMPMSVTHRFFCSWKGNMIGVVVMSTPNAFSNLLGKEKKDKEKLISRGACISWSPKNTASWLIMRSIRWMVNNTEFRYFTAYSDPEARELGTIYQACNFYYLGQRFGANKQYLDPDNLKRGWFGDVGFNDRSQIVRYAKKLGIDWNEEWYKKAGAHNQYRKVNWKAIPNEVVFQLKKEREKHKIKCKVRVPPKKHKYAYIMGKNKKETKELKRLFKKNNPNIDPFKYPKERGT